MIELQSDELIFAFPELREPLQERIRGWVDERLESATNDEKNMLPSSREEIHRAFAACMPRVSAAVSFQRTLRMPEHGKDYPLPLGLGRFSPYPVDDFSDLPQAWQQRGGVMLPVFRNEAMWLSFYADYPMALSVGTRGICAVSGEPWSLTLRTTPQNYVVLGSQPWLDGCHASAEIVRQFVGAPVGQGVLSAHARSGEDRWGGLQLRAVPLRAEEFWRQSLKATLTTRWDEMMTPIRHRAFRATPESGLTPEWTARTGGKIRLKIIDDPYGSFAWDNKLSSRCFAHLCLAEDWERLTGIRPPQKAPTVADYREAGVPWFNVDDFSPRMEGGTGLAANTYSASPFTESTRSGQPVAIGLAPRSIVRLNPDLRQKIREF